MNSVQKFYTNSQLVEKRIKFRNSCKIVCNVFKCTPISRQWLLKGIFFYLLKTNLYIWTSVLYLISKIWLNDLIVNFYIFWKYKLFQLSKNIVRNYVMWKLIIFEIRETFKIISNNSRDVFPPYLPLSLHDAWAEPDIHWLVRALAIFPLHLGQRNEYKYRVNSLTLSFHTQQLLKKEDFLIV